MVSSALVRNEEDSWRADSGERERLAEFSSLIIGRVRAFAERFMLCTVNLLGPEDSPMLQAGQELSLRKWSCQMTEQEPEVRGLNS